MILVTEGLKSYFINGAMLNSTTRTNYMTEYPTIQGTPFSDHYYRELETTSFEMHTSDVSKPMVYLKESDENGGVAERNLSTDEVNDLIQRWFKDATRVTINSVEPNRFLFNNMILQSYSWTDSDLKSFSPQLTFKEARVQSIRTGVVENADAYYRAAYGDTISIGGADAAETSSNIGTALSAGLSGAVAGGWLGAKIGSIFPGWGTAIGAGIGALVGGGIGFFGNLLSNDNN